MLRLGKTIYHGIKNSHFASSVYRPLHVPDDTLLDRLLPHVQRTRGCQPYDLSGTVPWQPMPDPIENLPLSHVLQRRLQRMKDLNYFFLSQQIVIDPLLWSPRPSPRTKLLYSLAYWLSESK